MSFLRHREIYRSDGLGFCKSGAQSGRLHAPTHRFDEYPAGYSLAGCAPAEPASASPAGRQSTMMGALQPSFFQRMGKPCLAGCLTSGVHLGPQTNRQLKQHNYQIDRHGYGNQGLTISN